MFQVGDRVVCTPDALKDFMDQTVFSANKVYTVRKYLTLEEYEKQNPDSSWWLNGETREKYKCGLVYLEEVLGADRSDLGWLANKFKPA